MVAEARTYGSFACIVKTKEEQFGVLVREAQVGQEVPNYIRM